MASRLSKLATHHQIPSTTQNDSPVPLFVTNVVLVVKIHLRGSNEQKIMKYQGYFDSFVELEEQTHRMIEVLVSLMVMTTDQLLRRHKNVFPRCRLEGVPRDP